MMSLKKACMAGGMAAALMASLCLAGCSTTAGVETTGKMSWDEQGARTTDKSVLFSNSGLKGDIQIVDVKSAMAGDVMRAQVTIRSKDRDTLPFQYRFEWFDANGMEINSGSATWKPIILYGRYSKTLQSMAPDPRAKDFKLNIREPDK